MQFHRYPLTSDANPTRPPCCPLFAPKQGLESKRDSRLIAVSPCAARCRREDSNLHSLSGNQVLNLARLPIPPLRREPVSYSGHRKIVKVKTRLEMLASFRWPREGPSPPAQAWPAPAFPPRVKPVQGACLMSRAVSPRTLLAVFLVISLAAVGSLVFVLLGGPFLPDGGGDDDGGLPRAAAQRLRMNNRLQTSVSLPKGIDANTPLKDALEYLSEEYQIPFLIDTPAFEVIGVQR